MTDTESDSDLSTIALCEQETITMSATVEVEDLAPPQRNFLADMASQYEETFIETAADMSINGDE